DLGGGAEVDDGGDAEGAHALGAPPGEAAEVAGAVDEARSDGRPGGGEEAAEVADVEGAVELDGAVGGASVVRGHGLHRTGASVIGGGGAASAADPSALLGRPGRTSSPLRDPLI